MYKKMQALFRQITTFLHLNKRLSKYFIFLLVSFSFWFLTIMSKEYETTIFIPISYSNFPESQQLISNLESQMELKVKSHGFYLLSNNLFQTKTLQISVNNLEESKERKYSQKQWVVNKNLKKIYKLISTDIKILSTNPDTLIFRFQKKESKKVKIVFNGDLNFSSQYRMKDRIRFFPDSIFIFGSKEEMSKINFVESEKTDFENIEKAIKQDLKLTELEGISFSEEKVQIQFEVEKFTEKIIELPLIAINVPKGYKIKCYPAKIDIVTTIAFDDYSKLNTNLFVAQVDASNLKQKKRLDVILSKQPSFIDILKIKPSRVEFLLIKE